MRNALGIPCIPHVLVKEAFSMVFNGKRSWPVSEVYGAEEAVEREL
jgi:hypothetical protein